MPGPQRPGLATGAERSALGARHSAGRELTPTTRTCAAIPHPQPSLAAACHGPARGLILSASVRLTDRGFSSQLGAVAASWSAQRKGETVPAGKTRRAEARDAEAIAAVQVRAWCESYGQWLAPERLGQLSVQDRARRWRQILAPADSPAALAAFVAEADAQGIVGFGSCGLQRSQELAKRGFGGEFQALYVLRSWQRCGLGGTLLADMARHLDRLAISAASCWVLRENEPARRFYEALGGQCVGERVDQQETGTALPEVAYGWHRLEALARRCVTPA